MADEQAPTSSQHERTPRIRLHELQCSAHTVCALAESTLSVCLCGRTWWQLRAPPLMPGQTDPKPRGGPLRAQATRRPPATAPQASQHRTQLPVTNQHMFKESQTHGSAITRRRSKHASRRPHRGVPIAPQPGAAQHVGAVEHGCTLAGFGAQLCRGSSSIVLITLTRRIGIAPGSLYRMVCVFGPRRPLATGSRGLETRTDRCQSQQLAAHAATGPAWAPAPIQQNGATKLANPNRYQGQILMGHREALTDRHGEMGGAPQAISGKESVIPPKGVRQH
jgi:hypothetical protein